MVHQPDVPSNSGRGVSVNSQAKTLCAVAAVIAGLLLLAMQMHRYRRTGEGRSEIWFYDQSTHRLHPVPRDTISPQGSADTDVRAMVIGFQGTGNDPASLRIAYLEKYSPALKSLLQRAIAAHEKRLPFSEKIPPSGSAYALENTFVRQTNESDWHEMGSPEGQQIVAGWHSWRGPAGQAPLISTPARR